VKRFIGRFAPACGTQGGQHSDIFRWTHQSSNASQAPNATRLDGFGEQLGDVVKKLDKVMQKLDSMAPKPN